MISLLRSLFSEIFLFFSAFWLILEGYNSIENSNKIAELRTELSDSLINLNAKTEYTEDFVNMFLCILVSIAYATSFLSQVP